MTLRLKNSILCFNISITTITEPVRQLNQLLLEKITFEKKKKQVSLNNLITNLSNY